MTYLHQRWGGFLPFRRWLGWTSGPSANLSTVMALKPNLYPAIWIKDYRNGVAIHQGFVQVVLTLVDPFLFVLDALLRPGTAQLVAGGAYGQRVYHWNIGHGFLQSAIEAILQRGVMPVIQT
jgi:hypothetical protein